ncbi:carboxypeptidase-like regulatory domain-containing protein [Ferruginibacter sp.]
MIVSYSNIQQLLPMIIEGKVVNRTGIPLGGAQVYFVPRIEETITSGKGEFSITTWMSLPVTLIVCHKNYESYKVTIASQPQSLVIKLNEK